MIEKIVQFVKDLDARLQYCGRIASKTVFRETKISFYFSENQNSPVIFISV
jgi:hypothetical protein